ncbi:MAG: hypothetical protein A2V67_13980 [Deltaproteobacteria bacterium RBG_13_61_14]|nr:MAG: hypothetical protein A2V67_13980 [Deltaproteobacteria bacterium RBG_13_61_14]
MKPTRHSASSEGGYRVDYYALLTGDCEPITIKNPRDESVDLSFFQLKNPRWVISCADCLSRPEIQKQVEDLFSAVP